MFPLKNLARKGLKPVRWQTITQTNADFNDDWNKMQTLSFTKMNL